MSVDYVSFECTHFVQAEQNNPDEHQAVAYAEIDGYPADENPEGTVICRIWLMKEKQGIYPTYLVDWHHNGYRTNEEVKNLIKEAKKDLEQYVKDLKEELCKHAYQLYKVRCMLDEGYTLSLLFDELQKKIDSSGNTDIAKALTEFEDEMSYRDRQVIWEPEAAFREGEWLDDEYMHELLSREDYELWSYK